MEDWKREYLNTLIIWFSFLFSVFLYFGVMATLRPYPANFEAYLNAFLKPKTPVPSIVKILYFLGIAEFFLVIFAKNLSITLFKKNPRLKVLIMSAIAEAIALYGMVAGLVGKGVFFVPLGILSIIGILVWMPKKSDFQNEDTNNLPYSFE